MEEFEAVIKANGFEVIETMRIKDDFPPPYTNDNYTNEQYKRLGFELQPAEPMPPPDIIYSFETFFAESWDNLPKETERFIRKYTKAIADEAKKLERVEGIDLYFIWRQYPHIKEWFDYERMEHKKKAFMRFAAGSNRLREKIKVTMPDSIWRKE